MCVAAYPLTWNRLYILDRRSPDGLLLLNVNSGGLTIGKLPDVLTDSAVIERTEWQFGFEPAKFRPDALHRVGHASGPNTRWLFFPLWLPALAISLFMAWRWRRSRCRQAAGFPVGEISN